MSQRLCYIETWPVLLIQQENEPLGKKGLCAGPVRGRTKGHFLGIEPGNIFYLSGVIECTSENLTADTSNKVVLEISSFLYSQSTGSHKIICPVHEHTSTFPMTADIGQNYSRHGVISCYKYLLAWLAHSEYLPMSARNPYQKTMCQCDCNRNTPWDIRQSLA